MSMLGPAGTDRDVTAQSHITSDPVRDMENEWEPRLWSSRYLPTKFKG